MGDVARAVTLPFTSSTDHEDPELMALEKSGRDFDANRSDVRKYFYRKLKDIDALSEKIEDENSFKTVLREKRATWDDTRRLVELEASHSHISHVACILIFSCIYAMVAATMLNMNNFIYSGAGGVMLLMQAVLGICSWLSSIYYADFREYERILEEIRQERSRR
jgi:hypothetical protein